MYRHSPNRTCIAISYVNSSLLQELNLGRLYSFHRIMMMSIYRNIAEGWMCISEAEYLALSTINVAQRLFRQVTQHATFFMM